ncbi:MAG: GHKL domain-containing protein [Proteobacteria bacterium]|nr:GHKL domain-containing protein [Pseudomonadota bacterium]
MATKKQPAPLTIPAGLNDLPLPLLVFKENPKGIWANSSFEKTFGSATPERFAKQPKIGLVHERPVHEMTFTIPGRHEGFGLDAVEGLKIPVELRVSPFPSAGEGAHLVIFEDVSAKQDLEKQLIENHLALTQAYQDLKRAQSALTQSAKLASLGELSSGIAHELNQPLQAIMGFSQELQESEKLSPTGTEFLADIVSASRKMAEIIKSLRSFAREAGEDLSETSVEHAVREAGKLVQHSLAQKGIELEVRSDAEATFVMANPIQLEQVFVNLMSNAMDAIESAHPGRGRIEVRITRSTDSVKVIVSDNGCGMSDEVKQRIFDPFFTTKEVGKGTGLGLSISHGILKKLGANVEVSSTPGHGTRFVIEFRPIGQTQEGEAA